jgi:hypothetical protein
MTVSELEAAFGVWCQFGGNMVYRPAPSAGENVSYWYASNQIVRAADGTRKPAFTEDTDTFTLDDRILELMLVCDRRKLKRVDYAEEMREAESALSLAISRDRGARMIAQQGRSRLNIPTAYPGVITP